YLDNRAKYEGIGNYNEEGFRAMEKAIPLAVATVRRALATAGLKMVYGTDAVAGAHGHNAEDLVCRVKEAGQSPMEAILSATSLAARSLGLQDVIGALAPGMEADLDRKSTRLNSSHGSNSYAVFCFLLSPPPTATLFPYTTLFRSMVYGTDAVAGAHGHNAEDLVCRVKEAGQSPMEAILSATSLAARSLGLQDVIGALAPGMEAD